LLVLREYSHVRPAFGVYVSVAPSPAGGVFVKWTASPRLHECTSRAFRLRRLNDPLLRHSAEVKAAMMRAMAAILISAGFTVQDADDAYRSYQLRVAAGPTPGVPPMWALRDDEVAMAGKEASDPDQSASWPDRDIPGDPPRTWQAQHGSAALRPRSPLRGQQTTASAKFLFE